MCNNLPAVVLAIFLLTYATDPTIEYPASVVAKLFPLWKVASWCYLGQAYTISFILRTTKTETSYFLHFTSRVVSVASMTYLQSPNCQSHSPEVCPRALQLRAQAVDPPNHLVPELQRNPAFTWVILSKIIANDERMRLFTATMFEFPFSVLLVSSNT